jgi:phosphatidylglycerophosphate synthase
MVAPSLQHAAGYCKRRGWKADWVTAVAFCIGLGVLPALYLQMYWLALLCIVLNRIGDGIDGTLARMTRVSDGGGFLDIVCDFIFYGAVVLGFALADPVRNGQAAAILLFSFIGTGSSFLGFAIMAERCGVENIVYPQKGIYYLGGLTEGTETLIFLVVFCLLPSHFPLLAYVFAFFCLATTMSRLIGGYVLLRRVESGSLLEKTRFLCNND